MSNRDCWTSLRGCGKVVSSSLLRCTSCWYASVSTQRFVRDLFHLEEDLEEDGVGVTADPVTRVRRAVWGMLYTDDAGIMCQSAEGLAKMMVVIMTVFEAAGFTVPEKKTETMLLWTRNQALRTSSLVIEAAGQRYRQATQFSYLGGSATPAPILCQISNDWFDSHGHATNGSSGSYTIWRMPRSL